MDDKNLGFLKIMGGLKSQDVRVKEWIYKFFWGYLMAISVRYLNDRDIAKEVVNDSFIKAFNNMHNFKFDQDKIVAEKTFKAWLAKITVRTALDRLRSVRSNLSFVDDYEEVKDHYIEVDSKLHVAEILNLLNGLPVLHRTVFNLYEIEGLTHDEVADLLKIPVSSSRTYLTRAKSKLRELYKINMQNC